MTVEARPLIIGRFMRIIGTVIILKVCPRQKRMTAMTNWVKRKKSGALVTFRTHLLLEVLKCQKNECQRRSIDEGVHHYHLMAKGKSARRETRRQTYRKCSDKIERDRGSLRGQKF